MRLAGSTTIAVPVAVLVELVPLHVVQRQCPCLRVAACEVRRPALDRHSSGTGNGPWSDSSGYSVTLHRRPSSGSAGRARSPCPGCTAAACRPRPRRRSPSSSGGAASPRPAVFQGLSGGNTSRAARMASASGVSNITGLSIAGILVVRSRSARSGPGGAAGAADGSALQAASNPAHRAQSPRIGRDIGNLLPRAFGTETHPTPEPAEAKPTSPRSHALRGNGRGGDAPRRGLHPGELPGRPRTSLPCEARDAERPKNVPTPSVGTRREELRQPDRVAPPALQLVGVLAGIVRPPRLGGAASSPRPRSICPVAALRTSASSAAINSAWSGVRSASTGLLTVTPR